MIGTRRSLLTVAAAGLASRAFPRVAPAIAQDGEPTRVLYVDNEAGDDGNSGSREEPFESIGRAASITEPGDRVEIASGDYDAPIVIDRSGTPEAPIVFAPAPGAEVRVHDSGIRISADHVVIDGLLVEDVSADDEGGIFITRGDGIVLNNITARRNDGAGVRAKASDGPVVDLRVSGGSFSENRRAGIAATGEDALVNLTIENLSVTDNAGDGIQIERASRVTVYGVLAARNGADDQRNGVFLKDVRGAEVGGVFAERNGHNGIALREAAEIRIARCISLVNGHHGFDSIENCADITFANNISFANGDTAEDKGLYITATNGVTILNNVFFNNAGDQVAFSDEGGSVEKIVSNHNLFGRSEGDRLIRWFSDYYANLETYQSASGLDAASIAGDPRLSDVAEHDFSLLPDSPAIDAGTAIAGITDTFAGKAPDIGAIEFRAEQDNQARLSALL